MNKQTRSYQPAILPLTFLLTMTATLNQDAYAQKKPLTVPSQTAPMRPTQVDPNVKALTVDPLSLTIPELKAELTRRGIVWKKSTTTKPSTARIAAPAPTVVMKGVPYIQGAKIGQDVTTSSTQPDGKQPDGPPEVHQENINGNMLCSTQRYKLWESPPEYTMKSLDLNYLWVGSFVKTAGLQLGSMQPINIPANRRKPIQLSAGTGGMGALIPPTLSDYNLAAMAVRQGLVGLVNTSNPNDPGYGSQVSYQVKEQSTAFSTALDMNLNIKMTNFSVDASGGFSNEEKKHKVSAIFVQNAFTLVADTQGNTPQNAFLLDPVADSAAVSGGAYIDSMTYGRMLFVEMTSTYSSAEMKAALEASYSKVSAGMAYQSKKVVSESSFKVYAAGGSEASIINLIKSQNLADYFAAPANALTLVPISFTARNFSDSSYAASQLMGDYAETVCNPNSVNVNYRVKLQMLLPEDQNTDEVYADINLDGSNIWQTDKNSYTSMNGGQVLNIHSSTTPMILNYGEARTMTLNGYAKDYDNTSADDVIGMWNSQIDLKAIAEQFKNGQNFVTKEFVYNPGKRPSTSIIIEFYR